MSSLDHTHWQRHLNTKIERDEYILKHEEFTDCTFIVGEEGHTKEFKCHRVYLAKTSPVFAAMLYGGLRDKNDVYRIKDITPEVFEAVLKYIYYFDLDAAIDHENPSVSFGFMYAAKKYLFPDSVLDACRKFIIDNLNSDFVWTALEIAMEFDEIEIHNKAIMFLQHCADDLLKTPDFLDVPFSVLETLVRQDHLNCTEVQLYNACVCWGRNELQRQGKVDEPEALKELLKPIIQHIRFLTMTTKEYFKGPVVDKVINESESLSVLARIADVNIGNYPKDLTTDITLRNCTFKDNEYDDESFIAKVCLPNQLKCKLSETKHIDFNEILQMQAVADFSFVQSWNHIGVSISTQMKPAGLEEESYDENLSILVYNYGEEKLLSHTRFSENVKYDTEIDVAYKEFVRLPGNTRLIVQIVFHTPGRYPVSTFHLLHNYGSGIEERQERKFQAKHIKEEFFARFMYTPNFRYINFMVYC